jgi:hypothetical protein
MVRRNSTLQQTGRGLDGGHRTDDVFGERRRSYLVACVERERGERVRLRAQVSRGTWASDVRLLKRRGLENVAGGRAVMGASTARDVGGRLGMD